MKKTRYFLVSFFITNSNGVTSHGDFVIGCKIFFNKKDFIAGILQEYPEYENLTITGIFEFKNKQDFENFSK